MCSHDRIQGEFAIRQQVFLHGFQTSVIDRQFDMGIGNHITVPGEVFATGSHAALAQAGSQRIGQGNDRSRATMEGPIANHP